jgi:hypothetical protein
MQIVCRYVDRQLTYLQISATFMRIFCRYCRPCCSYAAVLQQICDRYLQTFYIYVSLVRVSFHSILSHVYCTHLQWLANLHLLTNFRAIVLLCEFNLSSFCLICNQTLSQQPTQDSVPSLLVVLFSNLHSASRSTLFCFKQYAVLYLVCLKQWNEYNWNATFNRKLDAQLCKSPPVFPRKNKHGQTKYFYAISFDRVETPKKTRFREIKTNFVITFG